MDLCKKHQFERVPCFSKIIDSTFFLSLLHICCADNFHFFNPAFYYLTVLDLKEYDLQGAFYLPVIKGQYPEGLTISLKYSLS